MNIFLYFTKCYIKVLIVVLMIFLPIRFIFNQWFDDIYQHILEYQYHQINILDLILILLLSYIVKSFFHIHFYKEILRNKRKALKKSN